MIAGGRTLADRLALLLASGGGAGYSPVMPGTAGTLVAAGLALAFSLTALPANWVLAGLAVVASGLTLALGAPVERLTDGKDPGLFVLDEFAGFYLALWTRGARWPGIDEFVVAFVLFRLFDIIKPWPARALQDLRGGTGILLDDLLAGAYAWVGVWVYRDVRENPPW